MESETKNGVLKAGTKLIRKSDGVFVICGDNDPKAEFEVIEDADLDKPGFELGLKRTPQNTTYVWPVS